MPGPQGQTPLAPRDRVRRALDHLETDRAPRGEMLVEAEFLNRLYPGDGGAPWREKMLRLAEEVGLDLVSVRVGPELRGEEIDELRWWAGSTDRFVVALIDGLFWQPTDPIPFEEYLLGLKRGTPGFRALSQGKRRRALRAVEACLDQGAHGCLVGDDVAYDRGPFLAPDDLEKWIFPVWAELAEAIRGRGGAALLHSCGKLGSLLDRIAPIGFQGIHGHSESAGNDLWSALERNWGRIALLGGADVDTGDAPAMERFRRRAESRGLAGGYVLGSSSGLSRNTPPESFRALYGLPGAGFDTEASGQKTTPAPT